MIFKIDIDDFWLNEEEVESALKAYIIRDVVSKISVSMEEKIDRQITENAKELVNSKLDSIIKNKLAELLATEIIRIDKKEILITDYVKEQFENNRKWRSLTDHIKEMGENFAKEMKSQYDAAFANRVVVGMKEQGLLKDEVVKILLGEKSDN